jgi:thioredoxin-dependent peroxiredoxin
MGDWIEEGAKAPSFTLPTDVGPSVTLSNCLGNPVVLYFYPQDDTPGCTKQACAFRDRMHQIEELGAVIWGVSPDDLVSHAKFRLQYQLPFPLLSDTEHTVAEKYGAWREKNMYGKIRMGIQRSTFLIDARGYVAKVWKRVQVDGHDEQVLTALRKISPSP